MKKGFTLIELLVVIAIIGILSSVVLVSLNSARNKGKDTRIISSIQQLRTQFESNFANGVYTDISSAAANTLAQTAGSSTVVNQLVADLQTNGGVFNMVSATTQTAYALYGRLASDTTKYFCIDSTGKTNQAATVATGATCP